MGRNRKQVDDPIMYLENVISEWNDWQKHHYSLTESIKYVLEENDRLKAKIERLTELLDAKCDRCISNGRIEK